MAYTDASGAKLTKTQLLAKTTEIVYPSDRKFSEAIYETYTLPGTNFESYKRTAFNKNQVITQKELDAAFPTATIDTVSPVSGPIAGGTAITITGTSFAGASGVTIGGTAATNFKVVSPTKITCTAPAHAAGSVAVVVKDDAGDVTKTGGYAFI